MNTNIVHSFHILLLHGVVNGTQIFRKLLDKIGQSETLYRKVRNLEASQWMEGKLRVRLHNIMGQDLATKRGSY